MYVVYDKRLVERREVSVGGGVGIIPGPAETPGLGPVATSWGDVAASTSIPNSSIIAFTASNCL